MGLKIIGVEDVMKMLCVGKAKATEILNTKGCPIEPRRKGDPYRTNEEDFEYWYRTRYLKH